MTDLWTEATCDIEAEDAARRLTAARIEAESVLPFLRASASLADFDMRVTLAEERLLATAGAHAGQVVAEVRGEVQERLTAEAVGRCRCGKKTCSCTGSCNCKDGCSCAPCNQKKEASKRAFRIEADTAGGGYYVVDEQTGQDVGNYPTQSAAEHAAQNQPGLAVEPTGNPAAPGVTAPTSMPPAQTGSAPLAMDSDGDGQPDSQDPDAAAPPAPASGPEAAPTPASAPTGEGDANQDDPSDAVGNDESKDPSKTAAKHASFLGFKIALQEGEDPLLPILEVMDNSQGVPEKPSEHNDSQAELGAPSGHANGEIGTKDPQGDFMDLEKKSSSKNPFAREAKILVGWPATHAQGHAPDWKSMGSVTWPEEEHGPVSVPEGLQKHIHEGEPLARHIGETLHHFDSTHGAEAGPFRVGRTHSQVEQVHAQWHPAASKDGYVHAKVDGKVLGVHSEDNGPVVHHRALVRKENGALDVRYAQTAGSVPSLKEVMEQNHARNPRANHGEQFGLK